MNDVDRHFAEEKNNWQQAEAAELKKLTSASHHLYLNVAAYLTIAVAEYWLAIVGHSQTLRADALNNLSGIISTILLLIGIHIARDVDDDDIAGAKLPTPVSNSDGAEQRITFTRFRYQTIFTLVTGIIMIGICRQRYFHGDSGVDSCWREDDSQADYHLWGRNCQRDHVGRLVFEPAGWTKAAKCGGNCLGAR